MPQTPNVGVRHNRATFEHSGATWFRANMLHSSMAMPKSSMVVPPDVHSIQNFLFHALRTLHSLRNCFSTIRNCEEEEETLLTFPFLLE